MTAGIATIRYVKALFAAAEKAGSRAEVLTELQQLDGLLGGAPELVAALEDPRLPPAAKKKVLDAAGLESATPLLRDFVGLCLDKGRSEVVLEAAEEFQRLDREARGVVVARVQTVAPMDDAMRASVKAKLEELTAKSVELEEEVEPSLIGGLRIFIGSRMFDGSVRRRLDDLAAHLQGAR